MAKVIGPLHSDQAAGLYGGATAAGLVYANWRRIYYVRSWVKPANPRSVFQISNRAFLTGLIELWATFGDAEKAYWADYGQLFNLPAWNAFTSYNLKSKQEGWMPQDVVNSQHLTTETAPTNLAGQVVDNSLVLTWTDDAGAYTTGIHLGGTNAFPVSQTNLAYCTVTQGGVTRQCTIKCKAGVYYARARSGAVDGGVGAACVGVGPFVLV